MVVVIVQVVVVAARQVAVLIVVVLGAALALSGPIWAAAGRLLLGHRLDCPIELRSAAGLADCCVGR